MFNLLLSRNDILKYIFLNVNARFRYSPFWSCCSRLYIAFRDCGIVVWLRETIQGGNPLVASGHTTHCCSILICKGLQQGVP